MKKLLLSIHLFSLSSIPQGSSPISTSFFQTDSLITHSLEGLNIELELS